MNVNNRCPWCGNDPLYVRYHDDVWGVPETNSQALFAKLCLDGQQAGLSWYIVLKKIPAYYHAFDNFDPELIASYDEERILHLLQNPGIIRNRLKIESIQRNARAYIAMEEEGKSLSEFLWDFVDRKPIQHQFKTMGEVPAKSSLSDLISNELKKRGFNFVGSTIVYAFMQAVGIVNDHLLSCPSHKLCADLGN